MSARIRLRESVAVPAPHAAAPTWNRLPDVFRNAGLRLTRQRRFLAQLLFEDGRNRHVTASDLAQEAQRHGKRISQATIYNTLHQFVDLGLLRQVVIDSKATYFDTNIGDHHHFFYEDSGHLEDVNGDDIHIRKIPSPPEDTRIRRVDVVIHLKNTPAAGDKHPD